MKNKGCLAASVVLVLVLALGLCGCVKQADEPGPAAEPSSSAAVPQAAVRDVTSQQVDTTGVAAIEPTQPEPAAPEPSAEPAMIKATEDAMAESLTVNTDAPIYFMEEFDGEINDSDWETAYSFWVDEDVEEGDPEAVPDFSVDQRQGVLRFDLNSPYLYVYRNYVPYTYQDIRIDMEVENKAANTNNISLFCRSTDYGWYEFIATSGGYYSIVRYLEDGSEELANGGIRSIKFGADKRNVFTAICQGKTLAYMVNDVEIVSLRDDRIPYAGLAGFNVSAEEYLPVQVEVNWISFTYPN